MTKYPSLKFSPYNNTFNVYIYQEKKNIMRISLSTKVQEPNSSKNPMVKNPCSNELIRMKKLKRKKTNKKYRSDQNGKER